MEQLLDETVGKLTKYLPKMSGIDEDKLKKYLNRPPIKFLAIVIKAIHDETGFGKAVFSPDELKGNLPEREEKLRFFETLKRYTQICNQEKVDVDPKAIAAGKEVEKTLGLLQAIVKAAETPKVPFAKVATKFQKKDEAKPANPPPAEKAEKPAPPKAEGESPKQQRQKSPQKPPAEKPQPQAEKPPEEKPKPRPKPAPEPEESPKKRDESPPPKREEPKPQEEKPKPKPRPQPKKEEVVEEVQDDTTAGPSINARKAPPKVRDETNVVVDAIAPTVIKEQEVDDEVDDVFVEEDARGATGVVTSADNGKLVKDILKACSQLDPNQKGETDMGDADRFKQGIELAKGLLQHLARSAQPLDTLIQFSQEDLGNMKNEYKRWTQECDRQQRALEEERNKTETQLQELRNKIEELDKDIQRQESKLRTIKAAAFLKENELMKQFTTMCGNA